VKLGVFDSGLGGLLIAKSIHEKLPDADTVYLGDTLHVPYGARSAEAVLGYTQRAVEFLFEEDCQLIVIACNTASASALRILQQQYLPKHYPDRRILGVIVPTLEAATDKGRYAKLGLLGTAGLVNGGTYEQELNKLDPDIRLFQQAAPLLVPLIEQDGMRYIEPILADYLTPLIEKQIDGLVLGCTHYPYLKSLIRGMIPPQVDILSQDEIIPEKLADYLQRHPEINDKIDRNGMNRFCVTDLTESYIQTARLIYKDPIKIEKVLI
jgi:glutamate racemase